MRNALVLAERDGAVARLTLNDPERANVLSDAMMAQLSDALAEAEADPAVRVIVLAAAGKVFCAGHDLVELRAVDERAHNERVFARCSELMTAIVKSRAPIVARVQGAAVAAGCQLVASCDLAYAARSARFAVSGVNLGLFCSTPGVALARAIGPRPALEMLLTGRFVSAERAAALGLVTEAVEAAELDSKVAEAAAVIAAKPPEAIALGKRVFREQLAEPLERAYEVASAAMAENLGYQSARDGIDRFLGGER
jgi:enoyl-CoA hydratase/carnithine racemase